MDPAITLLATVAGVSLSAALVRRHRAIGAVVVITGIGLTLTAAERSTAVTLPPPLRLLHASQGRHVVAPGDTLWAIAAAQLRAEGIDPTSAAIATRWRRIYDLNRDVIGADPDLIVPGQELVLP